MRAVLVPRTRPPGDCEGGSCSSISQACARVGTKPRLKSTGPVAAAASEEDVRMLMFMCRSRSTGRRSSGHRTTDQLRRSSRVACVAGCSEDRVVDRLDEAAETAAHTNPATKRALSTDVGGGRRAGRVRRPPLLILFRSGPRRTRLAAPSRVSVAAGGTRHHHHRHHRHGSQLPRRASFTDRASSMRDAERLD